MDWTGVSNGILMFTIHGHVAKSNLADINELLKFIRPEDLREIEELGKRPIKENLIYGLLCGAPCLTLRTLKDEIIGILSVVPTGYRRAVIGMAGTTLLEQNQKAFLRGSLDVLKYLDTKYDLLYNVCDGRNATHHKWLKWLGFTFISHKKDEKTGVPIYEFARLN